MAEARVRDEWRRTSVLLALTANCHRDPKRTKAFRPADFDPFREPDRCCADDCDAAPARHGANRDDGACLDEVKLCR